MDAVLLRTDIRECIGGRTDPEPIPAQVYPA